MPPKPDQLTDLTIHQGLPGMPMAVFIHGLGMSARIWLAPESEKMLGGMLEMGRLLGEGNHHTLLHDLKSMGFSTATWSQKRPAGPIKAAVAELGALMRIISGHSPQSIIIIGHSRGGLIARAWLARQQGSATTKLRIKGLITICSPHHGSELAGWARKFAPAAALLKAHMPETKRAEFSEGLGRALEFLSSQGVEELLASSEFLRALPDSLPEGIAGYSLGGTNPTLITKPWFSFPDSIISALPDSMLPEELLHGKGDGLVSARSAIFDKGLGHQDFDNNHLTILTDTSPREAAAGIVKRLA